MLDVRSLGAATGGRAVITLRVPGISMRGPTGERDNLGRLLTVLTAVMPPRLAAVAHIYHDDSCPCADGNRPISDCTCETVDVVLEAVPTEAGS